MAGFEIFARVRFPRQSAFWSAVDYADRPIDVLFVGSSRVAAAVDVDAFKAQTSADLYVVNAAAGYSTPAEYYLAIRNTFRENGDRLQKSVIFVEAPGGMPDPARWSEPWAHSAASEMLTPLLRLDDLSRYWPNAQGNSVTARFENRLQFAFDDAFKFSSLITCRLPLGRRCLAVVEKPFIQILNRPFAAPTTVATADLNSAGGIRSDPEGILAARKLALEYAQEMLVNQRPVDWSATIVADTVALAQNSGARVVFFEPPLDSSHRAIYETPTRITDRIAFQKFAAVWKTPVLRADFKASDDDFPDIWHLRKSRALDYTRALATAWRQDQ